MAKDTAGTFVAAGVVGLVGWFLWTRYAATATSKITAGGPDDLPGRLGDLSAILGDIFTAKPVFDPSTLPSTLPPRPAGTDPICVPLFGCGDK